MSGAWGAIIWLVIAIALFMVESATVQLVCIWFAVGALIAMLATFLGAPPILQLLLFLITSIAVLIFGRPLLKDKLMPKKTATNADAIVGQSGVVIEEIDNALQTGRIHVGGLDWAACSAGEAIPAGRKVRVLKLDGLRLTVEQIEQDEGVED